MTSKPAIKMVAMLKRKPGISMDEFQHHYETSHAPLVLTVTPFLSRYTRSYIIQDSALGDLEGLEDSPCDVITEAWFDTEEDFRKFNEAALEPETRKRVVADELKFLDRKQLRMFVVKECESQIKRS